MTPGHGSGDRSETLEQPWDRLLSDRDRAVIEAAGYDERGASTWETRGVGERPGVLVVDMQRYIVGEDVPIFEAVEESAVAIGEAAWDAVDHIAPLLDEARSLDVPVFYSRVVPTRYDDPAHDDLGIVEPLAPAAGDVVVDKPFSSSFFGTDLSGRLVRAGVDTLVVVGNTTSGCLRATVVDAQQLGFDVVVPRECVFDRLDISHAVGLLDMWMKYANVLPVEAARELLAELAGA